MGVVTIVMGVMCDGGDVGLSGREVEHQRIANPVRVRALALTAWAQPDVCSSSCMQICTPFTKDCQPLLLIMQQTKWMPSATSYMDYKTHNYLV
jgi:hypothetical protein